MIQLPDDVGQEPVEAGGAVVFGLVDDARAGINRDGLVNESAHFDQRDRTGRLIVGKCHFKVEPVLLFVATALLGVLVIDLTATVTGSGFLAAQPRSPGSAAARAVDDGSAERDEISREFAGHGIDFDGRGTAAAELVVGVARVAKSLLLGGIVTNFVVSHDSNLATVVHRRHAVVGARSQVTIAHFTSDFAKHRVLEAFRKGQQFLARVLGGSGLNVAVTHPAVTKISSQGRSGECRSGQETGNSE